MMEVNAFKVVLIVFQVAFSTLFMKFDGNCNNRVLRDTNSTIIRICIRTFEKLLLIVYLSGMRNSSVVEIHMKLQ